MGQGAIYLTKTTNGGRSWSPPQRLAPEAVGHQLFPDISADRGRLFAIWHDSRNDPSYSVQRPPGNAAATDAQGYHLANPGLDTYGASSTNGGTAWSQTRLSAVTQQPNYEMFGDRQVPFHGDYNYVSNVGSFAYGTWTDTRQAPMLAEWTRTSTERPCPNDRQVEAARGVAEFRGAPAALAARSRRGRR